MSQVNKVGVGMNEIVQDLADEAGALDALLDSLEDDTWLTPTPAEGWDIRDSVAHIAHGNDVAYECATTGPGPLMRKAIEILAGEADRAGIERTLLAEGRRRSPAEVLDWWRSSNERLCKALRGKDTSERLQWGPNMMSAVSFTTARLEETWAHGLDCFAAAGVPATDTDRLRHIGFLSVLTLPYTLRSKGLPEPGPVGLELTLPSGEPWTFGPPDAPTVISGTASDWCRVACHRDRGDERSRIAARGPDASSVLANVQAFL